MNKPTCILRAPYRKMLRGHQTLMLKTDAGTLELREVADMFPWLTASSLHHRLFNAKNTSWQDDNIFSMKIPKTRKVPVPNPDALPLPGGKIRKDPTLMKIGTWERREKVWSMFRRETTLKNLPARDREYNDALKYNRAVAR